MFASSSRHLSGVRRRLANALRVGPRSVIRIHENMRLGNLLYAWLVVHAAQASGMQRKALLTPAGREWLDVFPIAELCIEPEKVRRWDRLEHVPGEHFQRFAVDFTRPALDAFVREVVLTASFNKAMSNLDPSAVTVSVRRGDYYSNAQIRRSFGLETKAFLKDAVQFTDSQSPISSFRVISDDTAWCRANLTWLCELAPVDFPDGSPLEDLAGLASAKRLILSNSTFAYWGAYISGVVHQGESSVVAPNLHAKHVNDGLAWQLDPMWTVLPARWEVQEGREGAGDG